ncbi:hypothetical protein [Paenibacillus sp. NAIST15-1]|uniref:hypothetical protein n=1 Tax=Paenibacillus sp. NAIST15-1 TaxID=1605994 RepID=UPI00086E19FD|nr:hypothetical protein [Paenibacillus sp. NAIST15-1]GAV11501.1 hypothetical protein PBN151_1430 [Paenibacillus sp. NAIST15-1]
MTEYKLYRYSSGDDEKLIMQSSDIDFSIMVAKEMSYDFYTCRLETWVDDKQEYGFRYFSKGEEITEQIIAAILAEYVE